MAEKYLGESIPKLGFGFMRLPHNDGGFDMEQIKRMVDTYLEEGFTYFDTAFIYQGSEQALSEALIKRYPREKYQIATKLPMMMIEKPEQMQTLFETSLQRLGIDYVDFYLLHGLDAKGNEKAEKLGAWEFVKELKAKGKIKHYGFSFHDTADSLETILTKHPDAEFVQLQINYLDWDSEEVQSERVYEVARRHNIPVTIMEPVKGGLLASDTSPIANVFKKANPNVSVASWAVRFAASLDGIITMLSGMSSYEQLVDNIKTVKNLKPLTEKEFKVIQEAVDVLNKVPRVPCTGCRYCIENCPQKISIPDMMDIYSNYMVYDTTANSDFPFFLATKDGGKPSDCIACKVCEEHCPQHIGISDILSKMVPLYEKT